MKVKALIELLQKLNPEAEILETGTAQDMSANIPFVADKIQVVSIPGMKKDDWFMIKWDGHQWGKTLNDVVRRRIYVLAQSRQYFVNWCYDTYGLKHFYSNEIVKTSNGTELIYISQPKQLQGLHNAEIIISSLPSWWSAEVEALVESARLP